MKLIGGCGTDRGGYRDNNQDAILFRTLERGGMTFALGVICDGIGGLDNGEIASQFIIEAAEKWFDAAAGWIDPANVDADIMLSHLRDGAEDWNYRLCELIREKGLRTGTTMSCLMLLGERGFIIHVGDSRIYRYNPVEGLMQLTTDAVVAKMSGGRMKSFLDNYMGKGDELWYQPFEVAVRPGDMFLYCSDGFYHELTAADAEYLYSRVIAGSHVNELCFEAIQTMVSRGERDNVSVGIICVEDAEERSEKPRSGGIFSLFSRKRNDAADDGPERTQL